MSNQAKHLCFCALCGALTVSVGMALLGSGFSMWSWFLGTLNGAAMGLSAVYFGEDG
jgi:hypothetical protein